MADPSNSGAQEIHRAIELHFSGRLDEAERAYRSILATNPNDSSAMHMLGVLLWHRGDIASAEQLLLHSLQMGPNIADFHKNIGTFYRDTGRPEPAMEHLRKAIELNPRYAGAYDTLGTALLTLNRIDESVAAFLSALEIEPDSAMARAHLGWARLRQDNLAEAIEQFRQSLKIDPNRAEAHTGLCSALAPLRQLDEAILHGQQAVRINPANPEAHMNLGGALAMQGRFDEALTCLLRAVELRPQYVEALVNLAYLLNRMDDIPRAAAAARQAILVDPNCAPAYSQLSQSLQVQAEFDEALQAAVRAVQIDPGFIAGWINLAMAHVVGGDAPQSIAAIRRALDLAPDFSVARSDLLLTLHYDPDIDRKAMFEEHRLYQICCVDPLKLPPMVHVSDRNPDRPLRIAYISPDFREHAMANFIEPILRSHDRSRYIVSCYSDGRLKDDITRRLRGYAACWYETADLSDAELAQKIHAAGEDIFIDLAGHTAHNRMIAFAHKPAPVQISYLGSLNTTGLSAMDYRITDAIVDPPGADDLLHTERLIRLPVFFCYQPPAEAPPIGPSPVQQLGKITFGSLNQPAKFNSRVLELWAKVLLRVPESRLLLNTHSKNLAMQRVAFLAQRGIDPARILPMPRRPREEYFDLYNQIDIALDPFPFNGHTTSCDALWMGVPVVTLTGNSYASRTCTGVLTHLPLPELIAKDHDQYVSIAAELAWDRDRLVGLRQTLRQRMLNSVITDGAKFTVSLENAYREVWTKWCMGDKS